MGSEDPRVDLKGTDMPVVGPRQQPDRQRDGGRRLGSGCAHPAEARGIFVTEIHEQLKAPEMTRGKGLNFEIDFSKTFSR